MSKRTILRLAQGCCALILLLPGMGCSKPAADALPLIGDIAVTKDQLIVKNGDPFVWRQATIRIDGAYTLKAAVVPRGNSAFPLASFLNEQGQPFKRGVLHLKRVDIRVDDTGRGQAGEFRW